jgi:hypothetical protein
VNPWLSTKYLAAVSNADALAVAPYFLFTLDATDQVLEKLFDQDDFYHETLAAAQTRGKELMVYEVNLHTTAGNAPTAARDIATTSAAAGSALAKRLLTAVNLGIKHQCLYTLAQYDAYIDSQQNNQRGLVKLWGIARDLGDTSRLRPTGLVMAMINQVLPADIHRIKSLTTDDSTITLTAFHNATGWALAAVSGNAQPQKITVNFPASAQKQYWRVLRLDRHSAADNNEEEANVRIAEEPMPSKNSQVEIMLPAYGFVMMIAAD